MFSLRSGTWLVCIPVTFVTIHIFLKLFTDVRPHPRHLYYYIQAVRRRGSSGLQAMLPCAVPGRGWSRQSVTGDLRRKGQTDLEMQIRPRACGKGKESTTTSCSCGREKGLFPHACQSDTGKQTGFPLRDRKWRVRRTDERVAGAR